MECEICGEKFIDNVDGTAILSYHKIIHHKIDPTVRKLTEGRQRHYWADPVKR